MILKKHSKKRKGIVFFEVKMIVLIVIFIFMLFYMILSYNIKQSAVKDTQDIESMLYTRYAFKKFLSDERCLGITAQTSNIIVLNKAKLDMLDSYKNVRLPCFYGDVHNYEVEIKNIDVSYRHIPRFVLLDKVILLADYSLTSQAPLDDNSDISTEDAIINQTKTLLIALDSMIYELKNKYLFMNFDIKLEIDAFSDMYEDEIYKIYPYQTFELEKAIDALEEYSSQTIPQGGSSIVDPLIKVTRGLENTTLIIISDMKFNHYPDESFIEKLKYKNIVVHVIMINSSRTRPFIIKKGVENYWGKITYCDMYVDPKNRIYKIGYEYTYNLYYDRGRGAYVPYIYYIRCLDPRQITENVNKLGIYKKIGDLKVSSYDYEEKAKNLALQTGGMFLKVSSSEDLEGAFDKLFKKIEEKSEETARNAVREKTIVSAPYYKHFGVLNNTPVEWGGREEVYVVPVVLEDEEGIGELGFMKFVSRFGEFERLYSIVMDVCNLNEDYSFMVRKEFSFPAIIRYQNNLLCLGNNLCKKVRCNKYLVFPAVLEKEVDLEFKVNKTHVGVRAL